MFLLRLNQYPKLKGVRRFQTFVPFVFVFSFSLFQVCLVSLDYALLISGMGILHLTYVYPKYNIIPDLSQLSEVTIYTEPMKKIFVGKCA